MSDISTKHDRSFDIVLAGRAAKPVLDADGAITGWRCHGHDPYKRVFHATAAEGTVLLPLMEAGGGQMIRIEYASSSTLGRFVGFLDPEIQERLDAARAAGDPGARRMVVPLVWVKGTPLDERARIVFDATPSGHPSGRLPDWNMQPDQVHAVFRGFAARLPYEGYEYAADRDDVPQTALRDVAEALWTRRGQGARVVACAHALWTAASILDLDLEAAAHMNAATQRLAAGLTDPGGPRPLEEHEHEALGAVVKRLCDIVENAGTGPAAVPFRYAIALIDTALTLAGHPLPREQA